MYRSCPFSTTKLHFQHFSVKWFISESTVWGKKVFCCKKCKIWFVEIFYCEALFVLDWFSAQGIPTDYDKNIDIYFTNTPRLFHASCMVCFPAKLQSKNIIRASQQRPGILRRKMMKGMKKNEDSSVEPSRPELLLKPWRHVSHAAPTWSWAQVRYIFIQGKEEHHRWQKQQQEHLLLLSAV